MASPSNSNKAYEEYNYEADRYLGGKGGKGRSKRALAENKTSAAADGSQRQGRIAVHKLQNNHANAMAARLHPGPKSGPAAGAAAAAGAADQQQQQQLAPTAAAGSFDDNDFIDIDKI